MCLLIMKESIGASLTLIHISLSLALRRYVSLDPQLPDDVRWDSIKPDKDVMATTCHLNFGFVGAVC